MEELTIGEVFICIEAYYERERQSLISRISSILRALSKKGDAYKGLMTNRDKQAKPRPVSWREATRQWLFAPPE